MLPEHGRIACSVCHAGQEYDFDRTQTEQSGWRITSNPLSWGNTRPEVVVLGFSKGPTQAGDLGRTPHDLIAYKGGRLPLARILHHIGLIPAPQTAIVDEIIGDPAGRFHFGSLVRCTVEQRDKSNGSWKGTGGGMLDKFIGTEFGRRIVGNCMSTHLGQLPDTTKLVVMLGMGTRGNYITACKAAWSQLRAGPWRTVNDVAYTDGAITVVHTEHFKSQGALLPNWLSGNDHPRGRFGLLAREAVRSSGISAQ